MEHANEQPAIVKPRRQAGGYSVGRRRRDQVDLEVRGHVSFSRFEVSTYRVGIVAEPQIKPGFNGVAGENLHSAEEVFKMAPRIFSSLELDHDREHFILFCLDNKNRVVGLKVISTGSLTMALVHPREVYHAAIVLRAAGVIFMHNHPSGDPAPSREDIDITKRLKEVGDVLGMRVLDHVVLGQDRYFSFSDKGLV
jgi:hypothetical protein